MLIISVCLLAMEIMCVNKLKLVNLQSIDTENEFVFSLMQAIKQVDINYYISYLMIYSSFIYLGLFYSSLLVFVISLQIVSVSMMTYALFKSSD